MSGHIEYHISAFHSVRRPRHIVRFSAFLLIFCLFSMSAPNALGYTIDKIDDLQQQFREKVVLSDIVTTFLSGVSLALLRPAAPGHTQQTIEQISIYPANPKILRGDKIVFSAVASAGGKTVNGVSFKWTVQDAAATTATRGLVASTFRPTRAGTYLITAISENGQRAQTAVVVKPNEGYGIQKLIQKRNADRTPQERQGIATMIQKGYLTSRNISSKHVYSYSSEHALYLLDKAKRAAAKAAQLSAAQNAPSQTQSRRTPSVSPKPNTIARNGKRAKGGPSAENDDMVAISDSQPNAPETRTTNSRSRRARAVDEDGWNGDNWSAADDPDNEVGNFIGRAPAGAVGNGDFQIAAPVLSLPGRGIDVNLNLVYNARLWSKANNLMSYDADRGYPGPGWNIGFGKMMYMGGESGCMLVTPEGVRRSHDGTPHSYQNGTYYSLYYEGHTTDGSFIDYTCTYSSSTNGDMFYGFATLANGTTISYGSPTSRYDQVFPTQITDAQGNYINISYVNNQGPNINTITDTLARTITFNYDTSSPARLINITGPGYNNTTRTFVRLHYTQMTLGYAFDGSLTTDTATDTPNVLDAIYYPDTNTGYWFGNSNSYSSYGMIAKDIQQRGMSWSGSAGTQGTVTQGTMTRECDYDFQMAADSTLLDAPYYRNTTESWAGMLTSAVTHYDVTNTTTDQVIKVTLPDPDNNIDTQTSHIDPGNFDDGFYYMNELNGPSQLHPLFARTKTFFGTGDYGTSRPTRIEVTDDGGHVSATDLVYATNTVQVPTHNEVITQKEYDWSGNLYRQVNNTYDTNSNYISRHVFNLLKTTETDDALGNRLTRTNYEYDNDAEDLGTGSPVLDHADGVVMHNSTSDPYTTDTQQVDGDNCMLWYPETATDPPCSYEDEEVWVFVTGGYYDNCHCEQYEQINVSAYDPSSIFRGNVTKTTVYSSASDLTGAIAYDFTYDITGNEKTATTNCCQQMSFDYADSYSDATNHHAFAYPTVHIKGSSDVNSSLRMTESAVYDFNTGVMTSATDFNGLATTYAYDAVSRPTLVTLHTGGKTTNAYDDANLTSTQAVQLADNTIVSNSATTVDGRGQTILSKYQAGATNWNAVSVQYDTMGRRSKVSTPYDSAVSPSQWTQYGYDALSRVTSVTAPDGSMSVNFYDGAATTPDSASGLLGQIVMSEDAWGRERWARTDDFGRLVEVVEPNPNGNGTMTNSGSLRTSYSYNQLDELSSVTQGSQTRSFAYDSLGRLTRQKMAEQTATLADDGHYVQSGDQSPKVWSDAFTYDARSNITQRTDARGVKTNFSYLIGGASDPLNRLQGISYDASTADATYTIDPAPSVAISYMTSGDQTRVASVATAGAATETNSYDTEGRISDYTLTLTSRSSYPMQTSYNYDTANRLTKITYPVQYGFGTQQRRTVIPLYDQASRLTTLGVGYGGAKGDSVTQLSDISYNTFGQVTSLKTGGTTNPDVEQYTYDGQTGLLANQKVIHVNNSATLLDLSYSYWRGNSVGTGGGRTGQLTSITNNLDHNKDRSFEFDALGRLAAAKGGLAAGATGVTANWSQTYAYDRYGNRTSVTPSGVTADSNAVPADGLTSLGYDTSSNRINSSGWQYDNAGNLIRGQNVSGVWQRFEYDAAGRLVKVKDDSNNVLETWTYGADRSRLVCETPTQRTYYAWGGSSVIQEYSEAIASSAPVYSKSYVYAGSRLLSTATVVSGSEVTEFHHPDRLGTKLVTNPGANTSFEQSTLPFGTELPAEGSGTGSTNQKFTSYDRSAGIGLDDAVNRIYSMGQSRFTQVDPLGSSAAVVGSPQSNNLFSYVRNDPTDFVDPSGLFIAPGPGHKSEPDWEAFWQFIFDSMEFEPPLVGDPGSVGGGVGGGGTGTQQPKSPPPCNAQRTGDSTVDTVAQVLFGESTSGNRDGYRMMGDAINNRYQMGLKEFGCGNQGAVALKGSVADEANNFGYRAAGSNKGLAKLSPDQCAAFKTAQDVAKSIVHGDISNSGIAGDRRLAGNTGAIPLWWRGGSASPGNGRITIGDTTFYIYDPQHPAVTSNNLYQKYLNKFEKNAVKGWHCGM